jgi:hypothetical protein
MLEACSEKLAAPNPISYFSLDGPMQMMPILSPPLHFPALGYHFADHGTDTTGCFLHEDPLGLTLNNQ